MNPLERRQATRFEGKLPIELEQGTGLTRDFIALGVYFETDQSLSDREPIKFVIPLDYSDWGHPVRIRCQGEVVRVEPRLGKMGVAGSKGGDVGSKTTFVDLIHWTSIMRLIHTKNSGRKGSWNYFMAVGVPYRVSEQEEL